MGKKEFFDTNDQQLITVKDFAKALFEKKLTIESRLC